LTRVGPKLGAQSAHHLRGSPLQTIPAREEEECSIDQLGMIAEFSLHDGVALWGGVIARYLLTPRGACSKNLRHYNEHNE